MDIRQQMQVVSHFSLLFPSPEKRLCPFGNKFAVSGNIRLEKTLKTDIFFKPLNQLKREARK